MDRIIYNNLDFTSVLTFTEKSKKKYIAILLQEIEGIVSDEETRKLIRKAVLDNVNELTRSWLRTTFSGEVEGMGLY